MIPGVGRYRPLTREVPACTVFRAPPLVRPVELPPANQANWPASPDSLGLPAENHAHWFSTEVQQHEPALRGYLRSAFPTLEVDDVVQESYLRIWRARLARPIRSTKAFLFQIARHLAVDGLRRNSTPLIASRDLAALAVIDDKPDAAEQLDYHERVAVLSDALAALPDRCREVVYLRKFRGLHQKEVAAQLGISVRTVESQFARGMRLCEAHLRRRGITGFSRDA
jgi:RNA polymerase sigma-70 factor (ECF subfamily)